MDVLPLLDVISTIARNGLRYTNSPYDKERYEQLLEIACQYYGKALDSPPVEIRQRLVTELGYITAKVGAEAALFDSTGRILLMCRADNGRWCLPGGWVAPNESPVETVVREAREEAGLDIRPMHLVDVFTRLPGAQHGPHTVVALVYLCEIVGGALAGSHEGATLQYWQIEDVPVWHAIHQKYALAARTAWQARQSSEL